MLAVLWTVEQQSCIETEISHFWLQCSWSSSFSFLFWMYVSSDRRNCFILLLKGKHSFVQMYKNEATEWVCFNSFLINVMFSCNTQISLLVKAIGKQPKHIFKRMFCCSFKLFVVIKSAFCFSHWILIVDELGFFFSPPEKTEDGSQILLEAILGGHSWLLLFLLYSVPFSFSWINR